ncbi:hypothetical protein [uncultured Methanolobus sp.]|uniref:hypothetical protein n=1 Tax=uncultured Methanolobus sp. TaxID=218300 RepID=UPI002AAA818A|nr:hypothetical protein [uncultured Methanolobus sp.]
MAEEKRIHIMSAGQSVHKTFPTASKMISYATKVYVVVEEDVYEESDDDETNSRLKPIIESIEELKRIADPFVEEGVEVVKIPDNTLDDIRDAVFRIYQKDKDAKYYLNLSGGGKGLSIGLFMMALWIEAVPYHIDRDGNARIISIPKVHMGNFRKNPNRITVLELLNAKLEKTLSRKELKGDLDKKYVPIKTSSGKAKKSLSYGGFNSLIQDLLEWGLIEQRPHKGSKKEVEYFITPDGQFTLQFIKV